MGAVGRRDNGQPAPRRPLFLKSGGSCLPGLLCPIRHSRELRAQTQTPDAPGWLVDFFQSALGKLGEAINQTLRPDGTMGALSLAVNSARVQVSQTGAYPRREARGRTML